MDNRQVKKEKIFGCAVLVLLNLLLFIYLFGGVNFSIRSALSNIGGDSTSLITEVKMFMDADTGLKTSDLGGVYGTNRSGTLSFYLFNDVRWLSYLFATITGSAEVAVNLTYIIGLLLNGFVCYFVLTSRDIHPMIAAGGAFLFETQYYVFVRAKDHLMLDMLYTIPLAILLCMWLGEEEEYLAFRKGFFVHKRNWITIIIAFLMVNSGIGYYMFFGCLLIGVTGVGKAIRQGKLQPIVQALKIGIMVGTFLVIELIPYLYNHFVMGVPSIGNTRTMPDSEKYAMKLFRLLLPPSSGFDRLNNRLQEYYGAAVYQYETTEYLGLIGLVGLVIMAIILIRGRNVRQELRMSALLTVFILLYATLGGGSAMVYVFIADFARCSNRLSVYLCFLCVLAVCIIVDELLKRFSTILIKRYALLVGCALFFGICFKSQFFQERYDNMQSQLIQAEMKDFVSQVEASAETDTLVFQMPFQNYPSGAQVHDMSLNALFLPYLYSHDLRWSYGSFIGEESYTINEYITSQNGADYFEALEQYGFGGVYIDSAAYSEEDMASIRDVFAEYGYGEPITSSSGRWLYYAL